TRSIPFASRAARRVQWRSGTPPKSLMFLPGIDFDPPRTGIRATVRTMVHPSSECGDRCLRPARGRCLPGRARSSCPPAFSCGAPHRVTASEAHYETGPGLGKKGALWVPKRAQAAPRAARPGTKQQAQAGTKKMSKAVSLNGRMVGEGHPTYINC